MLSVPRVSSIYQLKRLNATHRMNANYHQSRASASFPTQNSILIFLPPVKIEMMDRFLWDVNSVFIDHHHTSCMWDTIVVFASCCAGKHKKFTVLFIVLVLHNTKNRLIKKADWRKFIDIRIVNNSRIECQFVWVDCVDIDVWLIAYKYLLGTSSTGGDG